MMSLLNVTVKRGKISAGSDQTNSSNSDQQHNTFLVLKLENVKSSTHPLKGVDPAWDEEFLFETNKTRGIDLLVELWQKGLIWDNVIGYKLIQVDQLFQGQLAAQFNGYAVSPPQSKFHLTRWFTLDGDLLVAGGLDQPAIIGTKNPTPFMVLLDLRWELTSLVGGGVGVGGGDHTMMDQGGGGGVHMPFVEHSSVDNYNKIDIYGSISGYGNVAYDVDVPDYSRQFDQPPQQSYNNSEMYSSTTVYNGLEEDALYNRLRPDNNGCYDDDNGSYPLENSYGGDGTRSRESTFQDNNYSFYDSTYPNQTQQQQLQPPSCDMTKRPKLLPQVPRASAATATAATRALSDHQQTVPSAYINECGAAELSGSGFSSFDVYGVGIIAPTTHPYGTTTSEYPSALPYDLDNEYNYECDVVATRPARTRRKVLPSVAATAPKSQYQPPVSTSSLSQYNDEFENEPLSYNSQPPAKFEDQRSYCSGGTDIYKYELDALMGLTNHVDQLNWKNLSEGTNSYELGEDEFTTPLPRVSSKRKILPQIPVQSKYGSAKSLPATPATSVIGINGKSRKLPHPAATNSTGIPTSTTITGFTTNDFASHPYTDYHNQRPQFKSSYSADAGDEMMTSGYYHPHEDIQPYQNHHPASNTMTTMINNRQQMGGVGIGSSPVITSTGASAATGKPSLLADMKSLFSKTSSSILPAMSSTLNNVSSSLSATNPPVAAPHVQPKCPSVSSTAVNETDMSYDFMKSNKFEEATNRGSSMFQSEIDSTYYDDTENQLNNNFNMGDQEQSLYGYDSYEQSMSGYEEMTTTTTVVPKMLPSVPGLGSHNHQQLPYVTTTSSTSQARNFFQSKNNTTFHSTVENISEEDPPSSSALNPSNMRMSTNNSYELEDMSVDKSLYGSSFHTDIDEYDLIANGDIKQNFTYTEKNLSVATGSAVAGAGDINGGGPLKTDAKSKLGHNSFMDNDAVNNNSANRTVYGSTKSNANSEYVDEYSFNEATPGVADEYGGTYDQQNDHYYNEHGGVGHGEDQYYDGSYSGHGRKVVVPVSIAGPDGSAQEYYYGQVVELGTGVVGSNLEGIEELDEYERDEKDEEQSHPPYDYNYYSSSASNGGANGGLKKNSLKNSRDHEFIEEDEEQHLEDDSHLERENSEEYVDDEEEEEEEEGKEDSKQWNEDYRHHASDDEIIDTEAKRTATTAPVIPTTTAAVAAHTEVVGPSPLSGISALMSSMGPPVASQNSLSPGSMLAAGITTTLAANISNTITTTITGSPSIIFDSAGGEGGELGGGASTISKTMGALAAGEGAVKPTAKQRWHHAYNKIIMQLNVSKSINLRSSRHRVWVVHIDTYSRWGDLI